MHSTTYEVVVSRLEVQVPTYLSIRVAQRVDASTLDSTNIFDHENKNYIQLVFSTLPVSKDL